MNPTKLDTSATQKVFSSQLLEGVIQTTEVRIKMKTTIPWIKNERTDREQFRPHTLQGGRFSLAELKNISLARF